MQSVAPKIPFKVPMRDLILAYRKAKYDVFRERALHQAVAFAEYESELPVRLAELQRFLSKSPCEWDTTALGSIGTAYRVPKQDAWRQASDSHDHESFRTVVMPGVHMHVLSALWINRVGHRLDSIIRNCAKGSRLRRSLASGEYDLWAPGSFRSYAPNYRKWRDEAIHALESEALAGRPAALISLDIKSFYASVDPRLALRPDFLNLMLSSNGRPRLTYFEKSLTLRLRKALESWNGTAKQGPRVEGLPVGITASRVIANAVLIGLDAATVDVLAPIHYGRYVDDLLLVVRCSETETDEGLIARLREQHPLLAATDSPLELAINIPDLGAPLRTNGRKRSITRVAEPGDIHHVRQLSAALRFLSSESRLLPDDTAGDSTAAARSLRSPWDGSGETHEIIRSDSVTAERLSFAMLLRQARLRARDLHPDEWVASRQAFFHTIRRSLHDRSGLNKLYDYLPQILAIAAACSEWTWIERILFSALDGLEKRSVEEEQRNGTRDWGSYLEYLHTTAADTLLAALEPNDTAHLEQLLQLFQRLLRRRDPDDEDVIGEGHFQAILGLDLNFRDLAWRPAKRLLAMQTYEGPGVNGPMEPLEELLLSCPEVSERIEGATGALRKLGLPTSIVVPLWLCTRPLRPIEIAELDIGEQHSIEAFYAHATKLTEAIWGDASRLPVPRHTLRSSDIPETWAVGEGVPGEALVGVANLMTEEASWEAAACGHPDESGERYASLMRLVNSILRANPRPELVVFPELSVSRRWVATVADALTRARISVVVGLEYGGHTGAEGRDQQVVNECRLYLVQRAPTFGISVLKQYKQTPALGERLELRRVAGRELGAPSGARPVFELNGFRFAILICSELTDLRARASLRGNVDALLVPSWNHDLDSFGAWVEATSLDLHSYVVLANNRKYGDSRIRGPFRDKWRRDVLRVRGGTEDAVLCGPILVEALRREQSYQHVLDKSLFKPFPDGFRISPARRIVPGSRAKRGSE